MHTLLFTLLAVIGMGQDSKPFRLENALAELRTQRWAEGAATGEMGPPGRFWLLTQQILEHGTDSSFREMTRDANPLVQASGLFCLSRSANPEILTLRDATRWQTPLQYQFGCIVEGSIVGEFAFRLLTQPDFLGGPEMRPMLKPGEISLLCIELLADDRCATFHDKVSETLMFLDRNFPPFPMRMDLLQEFFAPLSMRQIVKGVGRLPARSDLQTILATVLRNPSFDTETRLTAASALTHDAAAEKILDEARPFLNGLGPQRLGDRFLAECRAIEAVDREEIVLCEENSPEETLALFVAASGWHRFPGQALWNTVRRDNGGHKGQLAAAGILDIADRLPEFSQSWNTHSSLAECLAWLLSMDDKDDDGWSRTLKIYLGTEGKEKLRARVYEALAKKDE